MYSDKFNSGYSLNNNNNKNNNNVNKNNLSSEKMKLSLEGPSVSSLQDYSFKNDSYEDIELKTTNIQLGVGTKKYVSKDFTTREEIAINKDFAHTIRAFVYRDKDLLARMYTNISKENKTFLEKDIMPNHTIIFYSFVRELNKPSKDKKSSSETSSSERIFEECPIKYEIYTPSEIDSGVVYRALERIKDEEDRRYRLF